MPRTKIKPLTLPEAVGLLDEIQTDYETQDSFETAGKIAILKDALAHGGYVRVESLAGISDIAALFAVGVTTASGWYMNRDRTGMPEPITVVSSKIPVWDVEAVIVWWNAWVPRKGAKAGTAPNGRKPR